MGHMAIPMIAFYVVECILVVKRMPTFGIQILASLTNEYPSIRLLTHHKLCELFLVKY